MVSSGSSVTPVSRRDNQDACCKQPQRGSDRSGSLSGGNADRQTGGTSALAGNNARRSGTGLGPASPLGTGQTTLDSNGKPVDAANPLGLDGNNLGASGENLMGMMATVVSTMMMVVTTMMQMVLSQLQKSGPAGIASGSGIASASSQPGSQAGGNQPVGFNGPGGNDPAANGKSIATGSNLPASSLAERFSADRVSQLYAGSAAPNVQQYLPHILGALKEQGIDDPQMALYALATIKVETGSFKPISEYSGGYAYEGRKDLGNTQPGDGHRFMGRGFIQLTGRANYESYGRQLGVDLVNNPELANDPQIAARVLALYLKNHEGRIRSALAAGDMAAARRVVNGGTNGLQGFSEAYRQGQALGLV